MEVPTLTTARLVLRALRLEDAASLHGALSDEANMRYWSRGPLATVAEVRDYIRWNVVGEGVQCFAVTEVATPGCALGWVVLIDRRTDIAEIGFILRPEVQGQGLGREAARRLLDYAFDTRGMRRVFADVDPQNTRCVRLLQWLGLQYEGHLRGTWETHLGIRDSLIYAMLRTDRSEVPPPGPTARS